MHIRDLYICGKETEQRDIISCRVFVLVRKSLC